MTAPTEFPLAWPYRTPRHRGRRLDGTFRTPLGAAIKNVEASLERFGSDTKRRVTGIVFSSNVGGLLRKAPDDPGVAVYFRWGDEPRVIAVDRYRLVEHNVQAIHHLIENRRSDHRHGGLSIVEASFEGFKALPAPEGWRHWTEVLDLPADSDAAAVRAAVRALAKRHHPDLPGGSATRMAEINRAEAEALAELGE